MKVKSVLKILVINVITFAILLVGVNWACGIYLKKNSQLLREDLPNYENDRDHAKKIFADYNRVQHEYEPFVGWKTRPYKGETLNINASGNRIHEMSGQATRGKSVHFFGGSTMWGEGSDDNSTIPALFNKKNPTYDVVNHGQLAYNSRQELDALISLYATGAKPDVVIFYDGVNDAAFLSPAVIKELPAHRLVPMYREKLYVSKFAPFKEIVAKIFYENTLKVVNGITYTATPENSPYDCIRNPEKAEQIAEMMLKNWEMAHELVTHRGGRFIAILQPAAFIGHPRVDHLKLDEELGKNFQAIYALVKQKIADRKHEWIVDLSDRFDGDEHIFIDFCHVSPNGNAIIAENISNLVNNQMLPANVTLSKLYP